jgi:hypothetical protein
MAFLLVILSFAASADVVVGNGKVETERRNLPAFRSIHVSGSGTLKVHRGPKQVEITCDSNILPYITTTVADGKLKIGLEPFTAIVGMAKMQFDVTLPELSGIELSGSGEAYVDAFGGDSFAATVSGSGGIKADLSYGKVELASSGSGGFDAKVKADSLELRCTGSGGAYVSGSANRAEIVVTGSAEVGARDLATGEARVTISGSGDVEVRAQKSLDARISGSGSVKYWGSPAVSQKVSGSGRVAKAGQ